MKTQFFTAAAITLGLLVPVVAHAQSGYVDVGYRNLDTGLGGGNADGVSVGGAVETNLGFGGLNLQVNGNHARLSDSGFDESASDFVAHVYKQNDSFALGGFVSGTDVLGEGIYGVGIEGTKYFGNFSVGALYSYNTVDNGGGHFNDVGANVKWFPVENVSLGATYDNVDYSGLGNANIWNAEVEWKTHTPVSLFASYGQVDAGGGSDSDKYSVGVRWNFGGGSLKAQERSGAKAQRATSAIARVLF